MLIERDAARCVTNFSITDREIFGDSQRATAKASELVSRLMGLIATHGDLPVWASDHTSIELAWFSPVEPDRQDRKPPACFMLG